MNFLNVAGENIGRPFNPEALQILIQETLVQLLAPPNFNHLQPTPPLPAELECFKARAFRWQATLR